MLAIKKLLYVLLRARLRAQLHASPWHLVRRALPVLLALPLLSAFNLAHAQNTVPDTLKQRLDACTTCHGEQGRAATDGYYPRIAGKPAGYLYNQLLNFRAGRRQYPLMTYMVDHLSDAYLQEIAQYFSDQHPPYPPPQPATDAPAMLERGRALVQNGDAGKKVPACIACHGAALTGVAPFVPGLLGLPRDYVNAQFGAWRNGIRHAKAPDCMAQITQQLSLEDIGAISAWLASQPVAANPLPLASVAALPAPPPIRCGSLEAAK